MVIRGKFVKTIIFQLGLCSSLLVVSITFLRAQPAEPFESLSIDRPDVSNLPTTVRPGHFQFELGLEFGKNDFVKEYNLPNFLLRTGLGKKTEFRFGISHHQLDSSESSSAKTYMANTISLKYRFVEENGIIPSIAIQPDVNFGFLDRDGRESPDIDYALILLFNNTLHEKIFINYNAGVLFSEEVTEYLASVSASFMHTHRLGYFLEAYHIAERFDFNNLSLDGGIMYLVSPRFQLDIYVGNQDALSSDRLYFGFGAGFRVDKGDMKPKTFKEIGIHH